MNTRNSKYENKYYPNTKVKFFRKIVKNPTGQKLEGVFPDFTPYSIFNVILPTSDWAKSDKEQFNFCLDVLRTYFKINENSFKLKLIADHPLLIDNDLNILHGNILNSDEILDKQVKDILKTSSDQQGRFFGYTWHHTENLGEMQLIPDFIHKTVRHTGGKHIWGTER